MIILVSSFTQCKTAKSTRLDLKGDKNLNKTIILFLSKDQMIMENVEKEVKEYGAEILYRYGTTNGMALKIPTDKSVDEAIEHFKKLNGVISVSKDQINTIQK